MLKRIPLHTIKKKQEDTWRQILSLFPHIYRLIQYAYIQDDTYTHRYASTSILHIGWYSYTLIHILAFKIHFVFAFFADYTLIHIFKPIHTHYTLRYASTSIYLYADTVSHWYIYIFSSQDTFSFCILCRLQWDWFLYTYTYIQADTYTLNIIHKDTLVQAYIYMLIQQRATACAMYASKLLPYASIYL